MMIASGWKNKGGTTERSPKCPNCGSWLQHWKNFCGLDAVDADNQDCAVYDCQNKADDGAHVHNPDEDGEWIVPMCKECNHPSNTGNFALKDKTVAVSANVAATCGTLPRGAKPKVDRIAATPADYALARTGTQGKSGAWFY
jgi:hypothetical protein